MNVEVSHLANGVRVVSHVMPHLETVSLGVWVASGARFERAQEHGISHLLEHMAFKGTRTRSARRIAEEIEAVGGDLNAATGPESTAYYARVLKADRALALELIADILRNPSFEPEELEREKSVIRQEIAAGQDNPEDLAFDLSQELAFPNQPLGRTILGTPDSLDGLGPAHLRTHLAEHYAPGSLVISAAGKLDHAAFVADADRLFGDLEARTAPAPEPGRYTGGSANIDKALEQAHVVLAFEGPRFGGAEFYTSQVLSSLLGGGMSSRLFQEVRERLGLCYSIYSFAWSLADTGLFGVHAATAPDQVAPLIDVVRRELARLAGTSVREPELARAKAQLKAGLLMSLESSGNRAEQLARQLQVSGRVMETDELTARVEDVGTEDVRALAGRMFADAVPTRVCVGPGAALASSESVGESSVTPVFAPE